MTWLAPLGFAPVAAASDLAQALACVPGPALFAARTGALVGFAQDEPPKGGFARLLGKRDRATLLAGLESVQKRLERACQTAPFLPADPAARVPADEWQSSLEAAEAPLLAALDQWGSTHQWELVLRWKPEPVLARDRETIAHAAQASGGGRAGLAEAVAEALRRDRDARLADVRAQLQAASLDLEPTPAEGDLELRLSVLVPHGGEAAIEAALGRLSPATSLAASADLRGPLPPISFAAVRVVVAGRARIEAAWASLGLGEEADATMLRLAWRRRAALLHPDRSGGDATLAAEAIGEARDAHALLGALVGERRMTLAQLRTRAGHLLLAPDRMPARAALEEAA